MPSFATGVVQFQRNVFPAKRDLFEALSRNQAPEALFITTSDARVEPALLTQSDPGDLFVCRNEGNIVPPFTGHMGGVAASIEFAVAGLNVPHVVICGHTDCDAMKGAMSPDLLDAMPHLKEWLGHAGAAVDLVNSMAPDASEADRVNMLVQQNVILQLRHLKTHPSVAARLARGDLSLHEIGRAHV